MAQWNTNALGEFLEKQKDYFYIYESFAKNYTSATFALCKVKKFAKFDSSLKEIENTVGATLSTLFPVILSHPAAVQSIIKVIILFFRN